MHDFGAEKVDFGGGISANRFFFFAAWAIAKRRRSIDIDMDEFCRLRSVFIVNSNSMMTQ